MAIHSGRRGDHMVYTWRLGLTPAWLDRAESPLAYRLAILLNRLGIIRSTYVPEVEQQ